MEGIIERVPELPEVETVTNGIKPHIEAKVISLVKVFTDKLRFPVDKKLAQKITGAKVTKVYRRAKYILLDLGHCERSEAIYTLIIHLGMTGRLEICGQSFEKIFHHKSKAKHDHIFIEFDDGTQLVFNDTRKFGLVDLAEKNNLKEHKLFKKLGLEPLTELNEKNFYEIIHARNKSIKATIMDANIIVGIGNIYACEALFSAGIHPEKLASKISKAKSKKLLEAIIDTLKRAIKAGGSTISDYAKADGSKGYFQHEFFVYDREDQACKVCGSKIHRFKQNGRSSFYCKKCQA